MTNLTDLPADRQAVLSLLVRQQRTYDQVATMLKIEPDAVRTRALDAVAELGGQAPAGVGEGERDQIADYLLGQQSESERIETLALLLDTAAGRTWARRVADALEPIAGDTLPAVPADPEEPTAARAARGSDLSASIGSDAPTADAAARRPRRPAQREQDDARRERRPRDRRPPERGPRERGRAGGGEHRERGRAGGGDLVDGLRTDRGLGVAIVAAALIVAAIIVFAVGSGGSSVPSTGPIPASAATATAASSTTAAGTATGATGSTSVTNEITLRPTSAGGRASGAVAVVNSGATPELAFTAQKLSAPPAGDHYVLWLYNSATQFEALGEVATVTNGSVSPVAVALPSNASSYSGIVLTLESSSRPAKPGAIILQGTSGSPF